MKRGPPSSASVGLASLLSGLRGLPPRLQRNPARPVPCASRKRRGSAHILVPLPPRRVGYPTCRPAPSQRPSSSGAGNRPATSRA
eukprot:3596001-Prorocentrum_lima.AAC.1